LVNRTNQDFLEHLARNASVSKVLAQVLVNRGIKDVEAINRFLSPSLDDLHDPYSMPDMRAAVERIRKSSEEAESVLVYGDYDADGLTATALLVSVLRALNIKTSFYIPNRITEGYGLRKEGVRKAHELGVDLIITVDCGISSEEEISLANSLGIEVIVTDHHEPPSRLPDAVAVVNPHRKDSLYPFKHLAGVGVTYKLCEALMKEGICANQDAAYNNILGLVAVGTVADSVPLIGENRILVAHGLKALSSKTSFPWIHALRESAGANSKEINSSLLSYTIIPRINAVGRLTDAHTVIEFLLTPDRSKAVEMAATIETNNKQRQKIEEEVYKSAFAMIETGQPDPAIVLFSSDWHPGVIGIVASRLAEMFYRPVFLFSVSGSIAKGSARSIRPFHIFNAVSICSDLLLAYGGHNQAAGLSISKENLAAFKEKINSIVKNALTEDDMVPTIEIDAGVEFHEVNFNLIREISLLEPFGNANRKPVLGAKTVEILDPKKVGNNHLKARSKQKSIIIDTIGFSMADSIDSIENSLKIDIAFIPWINEWNGSRHLQLNLKALKPSFS
jgi:single-stranded-DNA-specific exonuclease